METAMPKQFTVSMFNVGTVSSDVIPNPESGVKTEYFGNENHSLEYATANKNKYKVVIVKNPSGGIILKYQDGVKV